MNTSTSANNNQLDGNSEDSLAISTELSSSVNMNNFLPESCAEAQAAAAALISTELNTSCDQTNQGTAIAKSLNIAHGQENLPKIPVSQNINGDENSLTDSKAVENPEISIQSGETEDEKSKIQTENRIPENLYKQKNSEEREGSQKLNFDGTPNLRISKDAQHSLNSQVPDIVSRSGPDGNIFTNNGEGIMDHKNPIPVGENCQNFNSYPKELDKTKNVVTVDKQQLKDSETIKDQFERADNSKTKTFTPNNQAETNMSNGKPLSYNKEKDLRVIERMNDDNLKGTKPFQQANPPRASETDNAPKKTLRPILPPVASIDPLTNSQPNHLGKSFVSGQPLTQQNRTLQPNNQRQNDVSNPLQIRTMTYLNNSYQASSQNNFANEMKLNNSINIYNTNQNKTNINQVPINMIDTRSKFIPNNFKAPNQIRAGVHNLRQQPNQPITQQIRLSNLPNKKSWESEIRFPYSTGINPGVLNNQRPYYPRYDAPSSQYGVYTDNNNLTRNNFSSRTSSMGNITNNNQAFSIQRPDLFSEQQFQQNINRFRSPYFFMCPSPGDQTIGTDKLTMTQPYGNQGIVSSYQQPPNNVFPNPVKDYNLYSKPVSINEAKRCKNQFSDGDLNSLTGPQNFEERSNSTIGHTSINKQHDSLPYTQRTYNTIGQIISPQQSEMFMNRRNDNTLPVSQNSIHREQSPGYLNYHSGQTGNDLKAPFPSSSQTNQQFISQSQSFNPNFQRHPYDQYQHYYPGFPIPKANRGSLPDTIPPPKTQNITNSNFQTLYNQRPASSVSNIPNPEVPSFPCQTMTLTTMTISSTSSSSLSSTKEISKTTDSSIREESLLNNGQHSGSQRSQNKILELGVPTQSHSLTKYPTQLNMANNSKIKAQFSAPDTNTIPTNYSKDAYAITPNKEQNFYSPNNSDSILTWSQYFPQNFDPTRPLNSSQRGYMNYDPLHKDRNLNYQQQNMNSNFYASQSYNNYVQQVVPSFENFQGPQKPQNSLNPVSTGNNGAAVYNVGTTGQTFGNLQTENQPTISSQKFPIMQEITTSTAEEQTPWKPESQEKNLGFPTQPETSTTKPARNEQFQNFNLTSNTDPKEPETSPETEKSLQVLLPTTADGASTKTSDLLSKALSNPHLGMTSEESFLFSDFDPLFTSSLLTNDLDYFPENNSAFDQCFEDAASITMATLTPNEAQNQQNIDTVDPNQVPVSQQLAPLLNPQSNKSTDSSVPNIPLSQTPYYQIPPSQTSTGSVQIKTPNDYGTGDGKNLVPLTNKRNQSFISYVPGADVSIFSTNMGGTGSFAKNGNICPDDSIIKKFSDRCTSKTASQLAKSILEQDETGTGTKKRNRQKKERPPADPLRQETVKKPKKKTIVPKGPPRPRGRPPKNKFLGNASSVPVIPVIPDVIINKLDNINQVAILNSQTVAFENNVPKPINNLPEKVEINHPAVNAEPELNIKNSSQFSGSENSSKDAELSEFLINKNPIGSDKSDDKTPSNESLLLSEESAANSSPTLKRHHELSDREVIDVVTKCLESISRNEDKKSSDQIKDYQLDANSENPDDSGLVGRDSPLGGDYDSPEDQALSREEMLMNAYIELKKKLEERMNRSLWRQSYLKRHEPKDKAFRKLSKKECMTAYSGTTSWGPDNDLFSRYSSANNKLVARADSTSFDSNPDKQIENANQENLEIINVEIIENLDKVNEKKIDANEPLISSTDVSEPKDKTSKTGTTLRLPSMMEVVRTRLTDELPPLETIKPKSLKLESPKEQTESPTLIENVRSELSETGEIFPNLEKNIPSNEMEPIEEPERGDSSNEQSEETSLQPLRYSVLQPYSQSPLLPPAPPPPLPTQVSHFPSCREKVTPRKVGPTIVENAKICFEAIGKYLTKADSDFDSFLISYANIVQSLLNCGAERYGRIKAILLNSPQSESNELTPQKSKQTTETDSENSSPKNPLKFLRDIDASDIQGDGGGGGLGENTIDVEDFSSSYADIVKIILSSRADEYRNIKQALSRNICGGTDVGQGLTKSTEKSKSNHDASNETSITPPASCNETGSTTLAKVKRNSIKKIKGEIFESPSDVLKKPNKPKTKEGKDGNRMKSKVAIKEETTESNRKQTPKRKSKKNQDTSVDRKQSSSHGKKKTSGFRIILSSNYFVEQSGKGPNLSVNSKNSGTNIEDDYEDPMSRPPLSSDDGFVEESTGDYVMGLGFESGDEKLDSTFHVEPLRMDDEQTFDNINNNSVETKTLEKPVTWYEADFKTEKDDISSDSNANKEVNCKYNLSGSESKAAREDSNGMDKVSSETIGMGEEKKRQRPTRKAALAGIGVVRCSCGCCDDGPRLRDETVENQLRDLTMSFKNRNRAKIIKPKSASIPKKRGRPRKIDKCPQKIISKLWTDVSANEEESEENRDADKNLSDDEEPENIYSTFSVRNTFSHMTTSTHDDTVSDILRRPELYLNSDFDSDSDVFGDIDVLMDLSEDSDDSWKPKKSFKNGRREPLKKKGRDLDLEHNLLNDNTKDSLIGVSDSKPDNKDQNVTEEGQAIKTETTSEKDETNSLNRNVNSLAVTESTNDSALKKIDRYEEVSKPRISFKDFVPNLKLPPLLKAEISNPETSYETNPGTEIQDSSVPNEVAVESKMNFPQNVSKKIEKSLESFKYLNPEQNEISANIEDGGVLVTNNEVTCNNRTENSLDDQTSQTDPDLQPKTDDKKDLPDVSQEGNVEGLKSENVTDDPIKPEEPISSEERLRSLIEKITEINAETKRLNTKSSTPVENGSENTNNDPTKTLQCLAADFEVKDDDGIKVKTELLDTIDETMHCPIGMNDLDAYSSDSSDSSSSSNSSSSSDISSSSCSSNQWRKEEKDSMVSSSSLSKNLEVKMPSPLNSKKQKRYRNSKVEHDRFENKIIIRKTSLQKRTKKDRHMQKLMQENKNIFDIMSPNETEDEDEEKHLVGKDDKPEKGQSSGCFFYPVPKKSEVYSVIFSGISKSGNKTQKTKSAGKSTIGRTTKKSLTTKIDSQNGKQQKGLEISEGFSDNAKLSAETNLEILKENKRKRVKINKSLVNETKILVEPENVNNSDSYSGEIRTNILPDSKIPTDNNIEVSVSPSICSKTKAKKSIKKPKTELDSLNSKDNNPCLSFDAQKVRKRKKSIEPQISLTQSKEKEKESKEPLIFTEDPICNKKTKLGELSSDQNCDKPLKGDSLFFADDGSGKKRKRIRRPTTDRPILECTYCQKTFKKPSELLYHTRSHTGVRPFACNQCDKSFVSNAHLLRHQRTHSNEPRHVCPTCGRGFTQHYGMVVHQLIHSGLKPHNCPDCSKAFRTKGCLGSHRRKQHQEQIAKEKLVLHKNDPQDSK